LDAIKDEAVREIGRCPFGLGNITRTAIATAVYGLATLLLWIEDREDRKQRDRHFREEADNRKLNDLRSAFYEAWGYWQGYYMGSPETRADAAQMGRLYEAMTRCECQLRLTGYEAKQTTSGSP
jgi:hypothetical protein